jgi:hypothetical protein
LDKPKDRDWSRDRINFSSRSRSRVNKMRLLYAIDNVKMIK